MPPRLVTLLVFVLVFVLVAFVAPASEAGKAGPGAVATEAEIAPAVAAAVDPLSLFAASDQCLACHNGLSTAAGDDVSIGVSWRASMMAHSARDPYWQAAVRREQSDHPAALSAIEDECAVCHMPMSRLSEHAAGRSGRIFANLEGAGAASPLATLAIDGVGCTACHQIEADRLGHESSFTGRFAIDGTRPLGQRRLYGPVQVQPGLMRVMSSATGFAPSEATHIQQAEVCATCHTLYTHALGPQGEVIGRLPEQVPYLEWRHSTYNGQSCQSCHLRPLEAPVPFASVLAEPRSSFSPHVFRGGNFLITRMLNRHREELQVAALPQELDLNVLRTVEHLREETATLALTTRRRPDGKGEVTVTISSLAGHKLPTAYPSRRVWLHVTVRDGRAVLFESGRLEPSGAIAGNDNDADGRRCEPHYDEITDAGQVQVYESIMADAGGAVTTGLLSGVRYLKDNRLLPLGFDKASAGADIAVHGEAANDPSFTGGGDEVRYVIDVARDRAPLRVEAELWYQPVGYRWAQNLRDYDTAETRRFVRYYDGMATASATLLARATAAMPSP